MKQYILLLRGINVGGKNKLSMKELKIQMEIMGFKDVLPYLNSGNVLFKSTIDLPNLLKENIESMLARIFKLSIPVAIVTGELILEAIPQAPKNWGVSPDSKHNAIFILPPETPESFLEKIGETIASYEQISTYGSIIFWSAPIATFSKTRFSKIAGTALYPYMTVRNSNTTKKLYQLIKENI